MPLFRGIRVGEQFVSSLYKADADRHLAFWRCLLKISRDMARLWRERWLARTEKGVPVVERLQDAERCGAPAFLQPRTNTAPICREPVMTQ